MDKQICLESGLLLQIRTISGPLLSKKSGIGPKSGKSDLSGGTAEVFLIWTNVARTNVAWTNVT